MHLSDLKYFVAVAEEKSFTRASEQLFISQPSLTVSIKRLEDEFEKKLLIRKRGSKSIELTEEGSLVLTHAKKILREVDIMYLELREADKEKVRLGVPPIIGAYLFPKIIKRLDKNLISGLEMIETGSENMKKLLDEDKLEMCFIGTEAPLNDKFLETYFIMRDSYSIFVSLDHPLAKRKSVDFSELAGERFISLGDDFLQYKILKEICTEHEMFDEIKNFVIANEIQTAKSLISSGTGIGFLITSSLGSRKDIRAIPLNLPVYFYVYLVFKKGRELSGFERKMKENLIKANAGF